PAATHALPLHDALPVFSSNITPQHYFAGILFQVQRLHHEHDVFYILGKLSDDKLVVVDQFALAGINDMKAEAIDVDVKGQILPRSEEHTSELQSRENLV